MVKKISRQNIFRQLKLDFNSYLSPKHYKYGQVQSLKTWLNLQFLGAVEIRMRQSFTIFSLKEAI